MMKFSYQPALSTPSLRFGTELRFVDIPANQDGIEVHQADREWLRAGFESAGLLEADGTVTYMGYDVFPRDIFRINVFPKEQAPPDNTYIELTEKTAFEAHNLYRDELVPGRNTRSWRMIKSRIEAARPKN